MISITFVLVFYYQLLQQDQSPAVIKDYAVVESQAAGLSVEDQQKVLFTIDHESKFNPNAINRNDMAEGCDSRGLVQIRSCNHDTTDAQAYNPVYSVNFLIKNIDKCNTWWANTCGKYRTPLVE